MAQTPVDGTPYGETITLGSLPYLACDKSVWTAVYLGNTSQGLWRHTSANNEVSYTAPYIIFLNSDGNCMFADTDFRNNAGGMFFKLSQVQSNEIRLSQWLDVKRPYEVNGWDAVQLDPVRQKLLKIRSTYRPEVSMRFQIAYYKCDGTKWTMDYPHLFGQSYFPIIVSHTPWGTNRTQGNSQTDNKIVYLDHQSVCRTAVINPWAVVHFKTVDGSPATWTVPGVGPVGGSFQGFVVFNQ